MILVTGASGLLGANLLAALGAAGLPATATSRAAGPAGGARFLPADLSVPGEARRVVDAARPAVVVHAAALTSVDGCEKDPPAARRMNVDATLGLAAAARGAGARFVYISTDSVFDGVKGGYAEGDATGPLNVYAATKLAGERAAGEACPGALVVRTNFYGWNHQKRESLAEWIVSRLRSGQEVPGFEDVVFSPLLVNDLCGILLEMIRKPLSGIYHAGSPDSCSKHDFAVRISRAFGLPPERIRRTRVAEAALAAPRPLNTSLAVGKLARDLGRSLPTVDAGIARFRELAGSVETFRRDGTWPR